MKIQLTLCLLTLLCSLRSSSAAPVGPQLVLHASCCQENRDVKIPKGKVMALDQSPSHCRLRSVIVTTESKKKFCLDPDWSWTHKLQRAFGKE
ncbi:C-C motif chemokine 24-like [Anableps anableps]